MSKHHDERTSEQLICERIQDRIADLTEWSTTRDNAWVRVADGSRLVPRPRTVDHPPLIVQLAQAVGAGGSTAGGSSSGWESKPAANLEPIDALQQMSKAAREWVVVALCATPAGLSANLVLLAARAHELDHVNIRNLDAAVLRWWARARIVTVWDVAPLKPHVPCMACGHRGSLQVRLDPLAAVCLRCGAAWDSSTIGILGEHIRLTTGQPIEERWAGVTSPS